MSEKLAARIQAAIKREGCRPSGIGVQLKTGRSMMIGIILPDLSNPFGLDIIRGIDSVITPSNFMMLLAGTKLGVTEAETVAAAVSRGVDGIIVNPHLPRKEFERARKSAGPDIPFVLVDNCLPGSGIDFVGSDNRKGATELVKRLYASGHRRIGYIGTGRKLYASQERYSGYREGLALCGLQEDAKLVSRSLFGETGIPETLNAMLKAKPDALFVESLQYFKTGFEILDLRKIRIPEDIMLAGFDFSSPRREGIVSCLQDGEAMGRLAASRLKELISGNAGTGSPSFELLVEPKFDA